MLELISGNNSQVKSGVFILPFGFHRIAILKHKRVILLLDSCVYGTWNHNLNMIQSKALKTVYKLKQIHMKLQKLQNEYLHSVYTCSWLVQQYYCDSAFTVSNRRMINKIQIGWL